MISMFMKRAERNHDTEETDPWREMLLLKG